MDTQSATNSENCPENRLPQDDGCPDEREGYDWFWEHHPGKLSSLMADHLLVSDPAEGYDRSKHFYQGWSRAQVEYQSLKRLQSPDALRLPDSCTVKSRQRWDDAQRRSQILWDEERSELRLLLPLMRGPLEIRLPSSVRIANQPERSLIIAVAELTIGNSCVEVIVADEYLHMVTGLPSLQATRRALRGTLAKGCLRVHCDYPNIFHLANADYLAQTLGITPGARVIC